jgi:DNA methyltransferase 1-associated protein 1
MSDVKFILGIQPQSQEEKGPTRKKRKFEVTSDSKPALKKKKSGLAREVANLALNPTLYPAVEQPVVEKPKINRAARWAKTEIHSSANTKLKSSHWAKSTERIADYPFAKYSKKGPFLTYTDQEYNKYFKANDEGWTRQETDYLMEMCQQFEFKFIVIHDRWSFEGSKRSVEDIKDRYYSIRETLDNVHHVPKEDKLPPYDKRQEVLRKEQIKILNSRSIAIQKEEECLLPRYTSLISAFKEHKADSKRIVKCAQNTLILNQKKKLSASATKQQSALTKEMNAKFSRYSSAINAALTELGIQKPHMADQAATQKYNSIRSDLCILMELQRIQAEALYELQVLKGHKAILTNSDIPVVTIDSFLPDANELSLLPTIPGKDNLDWNIDDAGDELSDGDYDIPTLPKKATTPITRKSRSQSQNSRNRRATFKNSDGESEEEFNMTAEESEDFVNDDSDG